MTLLASVMLLASACTGKQASEKTASGLEPANFRTDCLLYTSPSPRD